MRRIRPRAPQNALGSANSGEAAIPAQDTLLCAGDRGAVTGSVTPDPTQRGRPSSCPEDHMQAADRSPSACAPRRPSETRAKITARAQRIRSRVRLRVRRRWAAVVFPCTLITPHGGEGCARARLALRSGAQVVYRTRPLLLNSLSPSRSLAGAVAWRGARAPLSSRPPPVPPCREGKNMPRLRGRLREGASGCGWLLRRPRLCPTFTGAAWQTDTFPLSDLRSGALNAQPEQHPQQQGVQNLRRREAAVAGGARHGASMGSRLTFPYLGAWTFDETTLSLLKV